MNKVHEEGISKFRLTLKRAPAPEQNQFIALEKWRALLYRLGLVGEYPTKQIGYGTLSSRLNKKSFIITGSQTGHLAHLQSHHYTRVIECDLKRGSVTAEGLIPPSRESLSHFEIYETNPSIQFVFHVHHAELWEFLKKTSQNSLASSSPHGVLETDMAISEYIAQKNAGLFIVQNLKNEIFSFGCSAEEAGKNILDLYRKLAVRH